MSEESPPGLDDAPDSFDGRAVDEEIDPGLDIDALRRRREVVFTVLALAAILGVAFAAARTLLNTRQPTRLELAAMAERAVRAELNGVAVTFPQLDDYIITTSGEQRYNLNGRVQVIQSDGVAHLFTFDCAIEPDYSGVWRPVSLKLRLGY